jgi:hypothetical protein
MPAFQIDFLAMDALGQLRDVHLNQSRAADCLLHAQLAPLHLPGKINLTFAS